jgi:hypothetical protein
MEESNIKKNAAIEKNPSGLNESSEGHDFDFYVDPVKEAKLLRKLDFGLIWIIMLLYLSAFLDRSNIGECPRHWVPFEHHLNFSKGTRNLRDS